VVPGLLIIAFVIPLITVVPIQTDVIDLQLNYRYRHYTRQGSWDSVVSEVESTYTTYEISAAVDLDNLSLALRDQEVREYPVWVNVSSWSVGDSVRVGDQIVTVMGDSERYGFECWNVELLNGTDVYYSMEFGIFLGTYYYEWNSSGGSYFVSETCQIELIFENLDDFFNVEHEFNSDAILLSLIISEMAVIIWLIEKGERGVLLRKS